MYSSHIVFDKIYKSLMKIQIDKMLRRQRFELLFKISWNCFIKKKFHNNYFLTKILFITVHQSNIFLRSLAKDFSQLKRKVSSSRFEQLRVWKRVNTPVWSIGHNFAHPGQSYLLYQNYFIRIYSILYHGHGNSQWFKQLKLPRFVSQITT